MFVQISRSPNGQPIRKELLVTGEVLQIGRAAGCKLLLLDHRVNLYHAAIRRSADGRLYIEKSEGANLYVNGSLALSAKLRPGMRILIGPYELIVEPPSGDYDLVLSAEVVSPSQDEQTHAALKHAPVSLAEAGLSKRKPAFWLVSSIALIFILLPMIPVLDPALPGWVTGVQKLLKKSWQVGEMSRGHHLISTKCDSCHQRSFEPVPDKSCESCHKTVTRHISDKALHDRVFRNLRCGECHHEHRGEKAQIIPDSQCRQCHANIRKKYDKTKLVNIHDFGSDHPAFKLTFETGRKDLPQIKISQDEKARLIEKTGIKFSHKVHLNKEGVSSPEGDTLLGCVDCHQPDDAGIRFKPISMKKNCQQSGCHSLNFKPPVYGRQLPHGSEHELMTVMREYYATAAIGRMAAGDNSPCGKVTLAGKNQPERALSCANNKAMENARVLFEPGTGCRECHEIGIPTEDDGDVHWKVAPVTINSHWLRNSRFPHAKHRTTRCIDCHDKTKSEKSSDVTIPDIEKCRECHAGSKQVTHKISNSCKSCHSFHKEGPVGEPHEVTQMTP
jgi:hypothetical protein